MEEIASVTWQEFLGLSETVPPPRPLRIAGAPVEQLQETLSRKNLLTKFPGRQEVRTYRRCSDFSGRYTSDGFEEANLEHYLRTLDHEIPLEGTYQYWAQIPIPASLADGLDFLSGLKGVQSPYLWVARNGHTEWLHTDMMHNFNMQLDGTKRFVLCGPEDSIAARPLLNLAELSKIGKAYMFGRFSASIFRSRPAWGESVDKRLAAASTYTSVELGAGDCLYIPPVWWHGVECKGGGSVSVSFFFRRSLGAWLDGYWAQRRKIGPIAIASLLGNHLFDYDDLMRSWVRRPFDVTPGGVKVEPACVEDLKRRLSSIVANNDDSPFLTLLVAELARNPLQRTTGQEMSYRYEWPDASDKTTPTLIGP